MDDAIASQTDLGEDVQPSDREPFQLPPEIRSLGTTQLRDLLAVGRAVVMRKAKSIQIANQVNSDSFYKLCTTRRWHPMKGPLEPWFVLVVKSELSHYFDRQLTIAEAEEGFQREGLPGHVASIETRVVEAGEESRLGDEAAAQVAEIRAAIAHHPLMPRVLDHREKGMKPKEIAEALNVSEREVYGALKLIKHHAARLRDRRRALRKEEP
jgi:DNA-directed RNA polymerase specialized sigma24 family protein